MFYIHTWTICRGLWGYFAQYIVFHRTDPGLEWSELKSNKLLKIMTTKLLYFWDHLKANVSVIYLRMYTCRQNREDMIIATKARFPSSAAEMASPNGFGLSRRLLVKACEDSLSRLQTDYIDLYQVLHFFCCKVSMGFKNVSEYRISYGTLTSTRAMYIFRQCH